MKMSQSFCIGYPHIRRHWQESISQHVVLKPCDLDTLIRPVSITEHTSSVVIQGKMEYSFWWWMLSPAMNFCKASGLDEPINKQGSPHMCALPLASLFKPCRLTSSSSNSVNFATFSFWVSHFSPIDRFLIPETRRLGRSRRRFLYTLSVYGGSSYADLHKTPNYCWRVLISYNWIHCSFSHTIDLHKVFFQYLGDSPLLDINSSHNLVE